MNYKKLLRVLIVFALLFPASSYQISISAQTVSDEDVEESENRKTIAENKKAELDALLPKPDRSELVGGTTVKGEFIETKMLGYCAMKSAAKNIADRIDTNIIPNYSTLVIYNEADVKMLLRYQLMNQRLLYLKSGYDSLCTPAGACAGANFQVRGFGVGLAVSKALEFLSLLKTDVDITASEVNISEKEIVAEIFNNLHKNYYTLYYPQRVPLGLLGLTTPAAPVAPGVPRGIPTINSELFNNIIALGEAYDKARELPAPSAKRDRLDQLYEATMRELGLLKVEETTRAAPPPPCPGGCTQTTNVNVNVGDKEKESASGGGGDKTFFSYLQAEALYNQMKATNSYWIDLQVVKAGGNMRVKSNIITNFILGSRVNFSGGAVVYFNIFNNEGKSKISGTVPAYEKYLKSSRITDNCGVKN